MEIQTLDALIPQACAAEFRHTALYRDYQRKPPP